MIKYNVIPVFILYYHRSNAGAWTDDEAYKIYREKLSTLRDLYMGQLGHLRHVLQEKRREFLLQWHSEGGAKPQGKRLSLLSLGTFS